MHILERGRILHFGSGLDLSIERIPIGIEGLALGIDSDKIVEQIMKRLKL